MSGNILRTLADNARIRVQNSMKVVSPNEMANLAKKMGSDTGFPFEKALKAEGMSFICECKKASPSKGVIAPEFLQRHPPGEG